MTDEVPAARLAPGRAGAATRPLPGPATRRLPGGHPDRRRGVVYTDGVLPRRDLLIVDDDRWVRAALVRHFRGAGLDAVVVDSGAAALAALTTATFAVLLVDVGMTPMDGLELVATVEDRGLRVPTILMTGWIDAATEGRARSMTATPARTGVGRPRTTSTR